MEDSFTIIYQNLVRARSPEDIFGSINATDPKERLSQLKKQYRYLIRQVHPDKHASDPKEQHMASEATSLLTAHYNDAMQAIGQGIYGTSAARKRVDKDAGMTFSVNGSEYTIFPESVEGDFCQVYFGERSTEEDLEHICLKIVKDEADNELLLNEASILKSIQHKSLPVYLDGFQIEDGRRANVLRAIEESYDLRTVREHFPDGLPQQHAVWVLDRLLSVAGYLHINKAIHGSIEPGNIMITPKNHNGLLIDFLLAISDAHQDGKAYLGVNEFSAPEIRTGARPHPAADMYSIGKSMIYLLGGHGKTFPPGIDSRLVTFIQGFTQDNPSKRTADAWKAWHKLCDLRTEMFGKKRFLELIIGGT